MKLFIKDQQDDLKRILQSFTLFAIAVNSVGIVMVSLMRLKVDAELYDEIKFLASAFLVKHEYLIDFTDGATHYHAYYVQPAWAKTKTRTAKIEDHIFYRWENAN